MKRFFRWLKREFEPDAAAICWLRHGSEWSYVRHAGEIDSDVGEYFCHSCQKTRFKREWL
jgi:hypothetical protein